MTRMRKAYAFDKMFAVIILVVIVSLLLMRLVTLLRAVSMPWLRKDPDRAKAPRRERKTTEILKRSVNAT